MNEENADPAPNVQQETQEENLDRDSYGDFVHSCLSLAGCILDTGEWQYTDQILTKSLIWGLIFRVDLQHKDSSLRFGLSRIICWKTSAGAISITIALWQS